MDTFRVRDSRVITNFKENNLYEWLTRRLPARQPASRQQPVWFSSAWLVACRRIMEINFRRNNLSCESAIKIYIHSASVSGGLELGKYTHTHTAAECTGVNGRALFHGVINNVVTRTRLFRWSGNTSARAGISFTNCVTHSVSDISMMLARHLTVGHTMA